MLEHRDGSVLKPYRRIAVGARMRTLGSGAFKNTMSGHEPSLFLASFCRLR